VNTADLLLEPHRLESSIAEVRNHLQHEHGWALGRKPLFPQVVLELRHEVGTDTGNGERLQISDVPRRIDL